MKQGKLIIADTGIQAAGKRKRDGKNYSEIMDESSHGTNGIGFLSGRTNTNSESMSAVHQICD